MTPREGAPRDGPPERWPARRAFRLGHAGRVHDDVDAELRFHLDERVEELMTQGLSREQAEAEARRRFGDVGRIGAELETIDTVTERRRGVGERLHAWGRDARLALRTLAARPGYTATVVLTLALAIGLNTAIYSAVRSVLLRPLPVAGLDRLIVLKADLLGLDLRDTPLSAADVHDLGQLTSAFEGVTGISSANATLSGQGEARRVAMAQTMGDFAAVFGVRPAVGRFYGPDASAPGSHRVVVLGHGLWQEMGGDPAIVGRSITLNDSAYQVVGVMPADFRYPRTASLWAPYVLHPEALTTPNARFRLDMTPVARLRPEIGPERLAAELRAELARWKARMPESSYDDPTQYRLGTTPLVEELAGQLQPILYVLLGAVLFVLLIACANVASLQLVRTTGRAREVAVRAALGAGRWPIVRQFLVESLVLAVAGGALGLVLGWLALQQLARREVAQFEVLRDLRLDGPVLALAVGVTLLAGFLFGVVPAWRASRVDAQGVLRDAARGASLGGARSRFLQFTVVAQVALTLVLLLGSGVMVRSLVEQLATDPGFRGERTLAMQITPPRTRYPRAARMALYDRIVERVRTLPGVEVAALTSKVPFSDMMLDSSPFTIRGAPPAADSTRPHANAMAVTPDYFRAMGIPVLRGRAFTDADRGDAPVAIVDEALARRYFPDEDPVGRQIDHYGFEGLTIVGVVRSVDQAELGDERHPTIYYPYAQLPYAWGAVVVRSTLAPAAVTNVVRGALREIDPELPVHDVQAMPERIARSVGARRLAVTVLGGFAALALALALLGTYGVLSYSTAQRTRELGIRLALGARPGAVVGMVLRSGLVLAGVGLALGVVAYLGLGRVLASVVYGVSPRDPATLAAGIALLLAAAFVACWVPARRAARVDAIVALRAD